MHALQAFGLLLATAVVTAFPRSLNVDNPAASYDPQIQSVTFKGSGCPAGSQSVALSANGRTFTVIYDKFVVHTGQGTSDDDYQKDCEVSIHFNHTPGYQFAVFTAEQRGYAQLRKGDRATVDAVFGYSEDNQEIKRTTGMSGPISDDYQKIDNFTSTTTRWSTCAKSGAVIISLELTVDSNSPDGTSQLTIDSTDFQFAQSPTTGIRSCTTIGKL